jgi:glycosyltransferase involved in cell wall biosynthesis
LQYIYIFYTFASMIEISLIVATYNRAEQLLTTLNSVAMQKCAPQRWECIIVDNNSADDTRARVERFISDHPTLNFRYHFEPQQGLSHARNAGINIAQGDIIAFVDDDERIADGFFNAYLELFAEKGDAMAAGGRVIAEYPSGRPTWMSRYTERPIANPIDFGPNVIPYPRKGIPAGGNMAFRSVVFRRVGIFDTTLGRKGKSLIGGEESDLFERIKAGGYACYYVPRAVMYHIIPAEKLTLSYFRRLSYNTGRSQLLRAKLHGRVFRLYLGEFLKWCATLLLCFVHTPAQSRYLLALRYNITRGILCSSK